MYIRKLSVLLILISMQAFAQGVDTTWNGWQFMLGEWTGVGTGAPGEGKGGYTFSRELQGTILVRKNYASYPAVQGRPAATHDDLMVVYHGANARTYAAYWDNEGHVINYGVAFSPDSTLIVFSSEQVAPSSPQFRLTYSKAGADSVGILFEVAPPGQPPRFARYIQAGAVRKKR